MPSDGLFRVLRGVVTLAGRTPWHRIRVEHGEDGRPPCSVIAGTPVIADNVVRGHRGFCDCALYDLRLTG